MGCVEVEFTRGSGEKWHYATKGSCCPFNIESIGSIVSGRFLPVCAGLALSPISKITAMLPIVHREGSTTLETTQEVNYKPHDNEMRMVVGHSQSGECSSLLLLRFLLTHSRWGLKWNV